MMNTTQPAVDIILQDRDARTAAIQERYIAAREQAREEGLRGGALVRRVAELINARRRQAQSVIVSARIFDVDQPGRDVSYRFAGLTPVDAMARAYAHAAAAGTSGVAVITDWRWIF